VSRSLTGNLKIVNTPKSMAYSEIPRKSTYVPTFTAFSQPMIGTLLGGPRDEPAQKTYILGFRIKSDCVVFITAEMLEVPALKVSLEQCPVSFSR
jgi:hypothetical protein